jgi:tyrosine aminotransferase
VQAAVPRVLTPQPGSKDELSLRSFNAHYSEVLRSNASICMEECAKCPELTCIQPRGAMYVMVRVELDRLVGFTDDTDFSSRLLMEENVFVLPGQCFNMPSFFRLVTCAPPEILREAIQRATDFCARYRKPTGASGTPGKKRKSIE